MKDYISKDDVLETYADLYQVFDDNPYICKELSEVYDKINDLKAQETDWISVEDEMPENEAIVIGYTPCDGYMFVGYHKTTKYGSGWYIITAMRSWKKMTKKVTHWKPLPEPPEKGK